MVEKSTELEKPRISQRVLKNGGIILLLGAIYLFASNIYSNRITLTEQYSGVVESVETTFSRDLVRETTFSVKLSNGDTVEIYQFGKVRVMEGDTVNVLKQQTESGLVRYGFIKHKKRPKDVER